jgi:transposase-like protein
MDAIVPSYKGFRYSAEIISHCVWLYHRFPLSFREVEEMMMERGVVVSHETIRQWCQKFGQTYANGLCRRRPRPGGKWISMRCSSRSTARPTQGLSGVHEVGVLVKVGSVQSVAQVRVQPRYM